MPLLHERDIDLYYETHGTGPPLLLINGFGSSSEMWSPFWKQLTDAHMVILFDNRGVGRSSVPDQPFTIREMAEDTVGLLDGLGIEQASIFGASMGGMIAQEVALDSLPRVRSLILGMTTCGGPHSVRVPVQQAQALVRSSSAIPHEEALEIRLRLIYSPEFLAQHHAELVEEDARIQYPTSLMGYRRQAEAVLGFDAYDRLPRILVPTLVLAGERDALIPPENSRILAQRIPGARLRMFANAGHGFTREKEDEAVDEIRDFLAGVERSPVHEVPLTAAA
jgi:pimeloyl-ACP methyl ester carboxylesterase